MGWVRKEEPDGFDKKEGETRIERKDESGSKGRSGWVRKGTMRVGSKGGTVEQQNEEGRAGATRHDEDAHVRGCTRGRTRGR